MLTNVTRPTAAHNSQQPSIPKVGRSERQHAKKDLHQIDGNENQVNHLTVRGGGQIMISSAWSTLWFCLTGPTRKKVVADGLLGLNSNTNGVEQNDRTLGGSLEVQLCKWEKI